jgi:hypothetical protein
MLTGNRKATVTPARSQRAIGLTRLPIPARAEEYDRASQEIVDALRRLPGLVAIYRAGSTSVPGISDLDWIAVIEPGAHPFEVWSGLSERARYLAMHAPFVVDRDTFRRHRWFAHLEPLELSFGTAVELDDRPLRSYSETLIGAESLVICLLSVLKQVSTGLFKVRPSLCQLNNLRHALPLARLTDTDAPQAARLAKDVAMLRETWFKTAEHDRAELMRDVAARSIPALLDALWTLGERHARETSPQVEMPLGPPWSNVVLVASYDLRRAGGVPRIHLPLVRSTRVAELRWRAAHPRVPLHPGLVELLAGAGDTEQGQFRSSRDQLVRGYRDFLAEHGRGYAGIGFATPFLGS